jgi:hypothetical protein
MNEPELLDRKNDHIILPNAPIPRMHLQQTPCGKKLCIESGPVGYEVRV